MNNELLERVLASPRLPSLPAVAIKIIDLVRQDEVELDDIAKAIHNDPGLTARILKTVNSSYYAQSKPVTGVNQALVVLGLRTVKTLALGFSLVPNLQKSSEDGEGFDHISYWKRSLLTATAAKMFADNAGSRFTEEAFLGGLLQDMGMIALHQVLGEDYEDVTEITGGHHTALSSAESDRIGITHAQVGSKLAESWNLPNVISHAIDQHHTLLDTDVHADSQDAQDPAEFVARCVAIGNLVAEVFIRSSDVSGEILKRLQERAEVWFGLEPDATEPLLMQIHEVTQEMQRLFELPTGNLGNASDVLFTANEALLKLSMRQHQQNQQLLEDVATDALTQIANRRAFDTELSKRFGLARSATPLAVIFIDVDHFKNFNDSHGHAIGDAVLIAFAKTLVQAVGGAGTVYRYGGEEFAVLCPSVTRQAAAELAELARKQVESSCKVASDNGSTLGITCSLGVSAHSGTTFSCAEVLVKAADRAVYAAKDAGRNRVRVFTPRNESQQAAQAA
ncbi:MAG: GGDEF domain-containing protein [Algisphaera sp.]